MTPPLEDPGTTSATEVIEVAVVGAHLEGQPLNHELTDRGGRLVRRTATAPSYRLFALETTPPKPALLRVAGDRHAAAIEVEVWALPVAGFATFVAAIPAPLGIGKVTLDDGSEVPGFICEVAALDGAEEITAHRGWRAYLAACG